MASRENFLQHMTAAAGLESESVPGVPVIELAGDNRLLIERHQGILEYGDKSICVQVNFGRIAVSGEDLILMHLSRQQLVISGRIDQIRIIRRR